MIYLGVDLSLTGTGLCVLNGDNNETATIKTSYKGCKRLEFIKQSVMAYVEFHNPDTVILEGYSYGSRIGQAFSIGELGGVVRLGLSSKYSVLVVPPTCLKKFITGKGNASKDVMLMKTFKKYGIEFTDNNKCDAFGLAQMGKAFSEGTKIKYEKEALEKVKFLV